MSDDLIERLRSEFGPFWDKIKPKAKGGGVELNGNAAVHIRDMGRKAADEIERLRAKLAAAEAAHVRVVHAYGLVVADLSRVEEALASKDSEIAELKRKLRE